MGKAGTPPVTAPPAWSLCKWVMTTASTSSGALPTRASSAASDPGTGAHLAAGESVAPIPVSTSTVRPAASRSR
nr:hypothetical protein GCM10020093_079960 [Planobispora longispora]